MTYKYLKFKVFCFFSLVLFPYYIQANTLALPDTASLTNKYSAAIKNYKTENYDEALGLLTEILRQKRLYDTDNPPKYHKVYNFMGVVFKKKGLLQKAIDYYHLAIENTKNEKSLAKYYNNIANIYTLRGDFPNANTYLFKSLNILESEAPKNYELIAIVYHSLGFCSIKSEDYREAISYSKKSLEILSKHLGGEDGETYHNCGVAYKMLDSLGQADACYKKAIECNIKNLGKNHYMTAISYMNYAGFYAYIEDYGQSEPLYNKAYGILSKKLGEKHLYTSYCYKNIGELYYQRKDYPNALKYYQKALVSKVYDFNDTSIYSTPDNVLPDLDLIEITKAKASAFEKLSEKENLKQNLIRALNTYESSVKLVEKLRTGYLYENSKLALSEKENDTYMSIIRISNKLLDITGDKKYIDIAFTYAEKSKYAVLRELINEEEAKATSIPDSISRKEKGVRELIGALRIQIENESQKEELDLLKLSQLKESLFLNSQKLEMLKNKMEEDYPEYYNQKYSNNIISINDLQQYIDGNQVLLEYVISDSILYSFLVSTEKIILDKTQLDSSFFQSIDFMNTFLHNEFRNSYVSFRTSSYKLYETLIKPHEGLLKGKRLLIVPDEQIALISLDILVDEPFKMTQGADYRLQPYLLYKYPIGYAYSSNLYVESVKKRTETKNRTLVIAPDYEYSKDSLPILPLKKGYFRKTTGFTGKVLKGKQATETNFKTNAGNYNIIHIYAHGREDKSSPAHSRIYFANCSDTLNDGYLFSHEINSLKISAKLVVLASCFSGSGKVYEGEGVMSLGRSFLNQGCNSLILALWYASYVPTMDELNRFQNYLKRGKSKDEALRLAKLKYLSKSNSINSHPKYWSSLIVTGDQNPIYRPSKKLHVTIIIFLATTFSIFCFRRKKG